MTDGEPHVFSHQVYEILSLERAVDSAKEAIAWYTKQHLFLSVLPQILPEKKAPFVKERMIV